MHTLHGVGDGLFSQTQNRSERQTGTGEEKVNEKAEGTDPKKQVLPGGKSDTEQDTSLNRTT